MIEVFKTNVSTQQEASMLIAQVHSNFKDYQANFDLEDCDNILRVVNAKGLVNAPLIIGLLQQLGFHAEILPGDDLPHNYFNMQVQQLLVC